MYLRLDLADNPTATSQEKGINWSTRRVYTKPAIEQQKLDYEFAIWKWMKSKKLRAPCYDGPVDLAIIFVFSTSKKKQIGQPKDTKPDLDNSAKLLIDVLGKMGFFAVGDQQICDLAIVKRWGKQPRIHILVSPHPKFAPMNEENFMEIWEETNNDL